MDEDDGLRGDGAPFAFPPAPNIEQLRKTWGRVIEFLVECESIFDFKLPDDGPDALRARYVVALVKTAALIRDFAGEECATSDYFHMLAQTLDDLNDGIVGDLVKKGKNPIGVGGRSTDPTPYWLVKGRVVRALALLRESGVSRERAAGDIARRFPELARLASGQSMNLATAILSWDSQYRGKKIKNRKASEMFDEGYEVSNYIAKQLSVEKAKAVAYTLLAEAEKMAVQIKSRSADSDGAPG